MSKAKGVFTLLYTLERDGHKIFRFDGHDCENMNIEDRFAIADGSGICPEDTDDGILWIDSKRSIRPAEHRHHEEQLFFAIPLLNESGIECSTIMNIKKTAMLIRHLRHLKIVLPNYWKPIVDSKNISFQHWPETSGHSKGYSTDNWRQDVQDEKTCLGYDEWVMEKMEECDYGEYTRQT